MLLYLVKHSCLYLANITRELSKANDSANPAAFMELLHVWEIVCFSNSDYVGDPVSRQSISVIILYVLGVSVSW